MILVFAVSATIFEWLKGHQAWRTPALKHNLTIKLRQSKPKTNIAAELIGRRLRKTVISGRRLNFHLNQRVVRRRSRQFRCSLVERQNVWVSVPVERTDFAGLERVIQHRWISITPGRSG